MNIREQYKLAYAIARKATNTNASFAGYESRTAKENIGALASDNAWLTMCHMHDRNSCGQRYRMIVSDKRFVMHGGVKAWRDYCVWFYTRKV